MSKPNIILTGFMATGKTTVGKMLAEQLKYEFVDTDDLIVKRYGQTVAEIFREKGEAAFRRMESEIAQELGEKEGFVVSTGGRLMLDPANAAALSRRGRVFCLVATPEDILQRVESDTQVRRPLLEVSNPIERIVDLMQQREDDYGRFPQMVTSQKTPDEVTRNMVGIFQANPDLRLSITAPDVRYEFIGRDSTFCFSVGRHWWSGCHYNGQQHRPTVRRKLRAYGCSGISSTRTAA